MRRSCACFPDRLQGRPPWRAWLVGVAVLLAGLPPAPVATAAEEIRLAPEPISIIVLDRPPYYEVREGQPAGFLLLRAKQHFEAAGLPISDYATLPPRRILALIRQNAARICSVGWFRTAERESYARYSAPIHVDRPYIVLAHPDAAAAVRAKGSLLTLMDDPDLRLGLVDGYSYGSYLDALVRARHGATDTDSPTAAQLLKRLANGRIDFALFDREEADALMADNELAKPLRTVFLNGMPDGQRRYLICSQRVAEAEMKALDAAIARRAARAVQ
jgi:polar amino acid transport system substrate-binding protein